MFGAPAERARADQPDRERPDYAGREDAPPDAGDVLIWVPRVIFFPVYLVTEYLVRWPIGTLVTWMEQSQVVERAFQIFTFGTGGRAGLVPTFLVDFGFRPSIGLYFWATELFGPGDSFGMHFAWGGSRWWRFSVRQRFQFGGHDRGPADPEQPPVLGSGSETPLVGPKRELGFWFLLSYRPDRLFYGLGPTAGTLPSRFEDRALGGGASYTELFGPLSSLELTLEVNRHQLADGDVDRDGGEVAISEAFNVDALPGFSGYLLGMMRLDLDLDSRSPRPSSGSGVQLRAHAHLGTDLQNTDLLFLRYGGSLTFFLDLSGRNQVLGVRQWIGLIEELGDAPTPFTEQYVVGGDLNLIRGLLEGRYRGPAGTVTSLFYTYPIWVFLDGFMVLDVGNAWGPNFALFDVEEMAASLSMGVASGTERDNTFNFLIGLGTTRFSADVFGVESVRVLFGTSSF